MVRSDFYPHRLFKISKYSLIKRKETLLNSSITATVPLISEIMLDHANNVPIHLDKFIQTHVQYYILTNALFYLLSTARQIKDSFIE
jgi:hypothetical protein